MAMTQSILSKLELLLGAQSKIIPWEKVDAIWLEKIRKAIGNNINNTSPVCLVFPETTKDLSSLVGLCYENYWSILICGSGSKLNWGGLVDSPIIVISTSELNKVIDHAVGDLTVTVEAGLTLKDLQKYLKPSGQFLPLDCSHADRATLGGIMATADAGSWRQRYGGVRDMVLGFSFIRSDGKLAKAGGRVVKNVAGYDLMKLFTGSYGTLGIISQITFRLYPLLSTSATLLISADAEAIAKLSQIIRQSGLTPTKADILSPATVRACGLKQNIGLVLCWETIPPSIEQQLATVRILAKELNCQMEEYEGEEEVNLWRKLQNLIDRSTQNLDTSCKIGIQSAHIVTLVEQLNEINENGLAAINLSSGVGKMRIESLETATKLRSICQSYGGFLTLLDTPKEYQNDYDTWGYTGNTEVIMRTIKSKFDPYNIFNPRKFINKI